MNIVININRKYIFPAKIMLFSLAENCREELNIYCLHKELSQKNIKEFSNFIECKCHGKLYPIYMGDKYNDMPLLQSHISSEAYFRLDAVNILPDSVERFLYLDCDIIVLGDLSEFYYQSFDDKLIIASSDYLSRGEENPILNELKENNVTFADGHIYFNSGVILFNAAKIRDVFTGDDINKYVEQYRDKLIYMDQDILNIMYSGNVKYMESSNYNFQISYMDKFDLSDEKNKEIFLLHFICKVKPWNYRCLNDAKWLFWQYARKCGYRRKYFLFKVGNSLCCFFMKIIFKILKIKY